MHEAGALRLAMRGVSRSAAEPGAYASGYGEFLKLHTLADISTCE